MGSTILSLGHYAPERRVTNSEIEERLDLPAGWIERRTGIRERRYAAEGEALSDIAVKAGRMALARAGFDPARIGLLVLATSTPDHLLPPTGPLVAHRLGLDGAGAIDMAGACAGFLYALAFADGFVCAQRQPVLVIAANILSRRTNFSDRNSSVLFGDAAGAVLLVPSERPGTGVLGLNLASNGAEYGLIDIPAGGSRRPFSDALAPEETKMRIIDGKAVFAKASALMVKCSEAALARAGLGISDIQHFIPHQANARMMALIERELGVEPGKLLSSVAHYGNSSAATIPFTLSLQAGTREFMAGDRMLMCAAGAGLTGGAVVFGV
ncbi:MAG: beta-ketoacyl-ACP synthase III [Hyphomicrobium sp.]|jgi:3-oxoacyl-[acyl-carrier-protein] synthase-3